MLAEAEVTVTLNARAEQVRTMHIYRLANMYPGTGTSIHARIGNDVFAKYWKTTMLFKENRAHCHGGRPIDIYVIKLADGSTISSNVLVNVGDLWRESRSSDTVTWPNLPFVQGRFNPEVGRIVRKLTLRPKMPVYPVSGKWQDVNTGVTPNVPINTNTEENFYKVSFSIPINKKVRFSNTVREVPKQLPEYCVLFHQPDNWQNSSAIYNLEYCYSQFFFGDP